MDFVAALLMLIPALFSHGGHQRVFEKYGRIEIRECKTAGGNAHPIGVLISGWIYELDDLDGQAREKIRKQYFKGDKNSEGIFFVNMQQPECEKLKSDKYIGFMYLIQDCTGPHKKGCDEIGTPFLGTGPFKTNVQPQN